MGIIETIALLDGTSAFLKEVGLAAAGRGVEVRIAEEPHVEFGGVPCSGFFDDVAKVLAVATRKPLRDWLPTLVHEYCHMLQWVEGAQVWKDCYVGGEEALKVIDRWLAGEDVDAAVIDECTRRAIDIEVDCERRTLSKIQEYRLPLDPRRYAQQSNAYILFYHQMRLTRRWYDPTLAPYANEAVWSRMPASLDALNYHDGVTALAMADFALCQSRSE